MSTQNRHNLRLFSSVLFLPLLMEGLTVLRGGVNGFLTGVIYMGFLFYAIITTYSHIRAKDVIILAGVYSFFIINILIFPSTIEYYKDKALTLAMVFYLPICAFVISHIRDWNNLFDVMKPFAVASVGIAIFIVFLSDISLYEEFFTYMDFSYCLLPFVVTLYVISRKRGSLLWFVLFVIDAICQILYGARATFLFMMIFIVGYEYFNCETRYRIYVLLIFLLIAGIITVFFNNIILFLSGIDGVKDSRLIAKAIAGQLTDGGERDRLMIQSLKRITTMGMEIPGIYGDRAYVQGIYPHNIALEILMQFGILPGICILINFLGLIIVDIFRTPYVIPTIFLCCILFGRFLISGSYIQDGTFWLWLFSMVNIFRQREKMPIRIVESRRMITF